MPESSMPNTGSPKLKRKTTAENWDDDFEFSIPSRSTRPSSSSSKTASQPNKLVPHRSRPSISQLDQQSGESRANSAGAIAQTEPGGKDSRRKTPRKGSESPEEDWDEDVAESSDTHAARAQSGGKKREQYPRSNAAVDEGTIRRPQTTCGPSERRSSLQYRRQSRPPPTISIPSPGLAPPRLSSSPTSPFTPSSEPPSGNTDAPLVEDSAASVGRPPTHSQPHAGPSMNRRPSQSATGRNKLVKRHPSISFETLPTASIHSITNDSTSPIPTWSHGNRSVPNLPVPVQQPGISGIGSKAESQAEARSKTSSRDLRHMKSAEIMPPPPLPSTFASTSNGGSGFGPGSAVGELVRRKSKRGKEREVRESAIPFSPSMEQIRLVDQQAGGGKEKSFWKRLSGSGAGRTGSPTLATHQDTLHRRRRSSSTGSPTKLRPFLSPSSTSQPPLPPLPHQFRSPSAASSNSAHSTASATSNISAISVSGNISNPSTTLSTRPSGLTGILRRSTSSLIKRDHPAASPSPPSSYTPVSAFQASHTDLPGLPPVSSSSRHASRGPSRSASQQSLSKGYHLPSPSPQSPYRKGSHFLPGSNQSEEVPPLPRSSSFRSQASSMIRHGARSTAVDADLSDDDADPNQITPRRPSRTSRSRDSDAQSSSRIKAGWGGNGWSGFPTMSRSSSVARSDIASLAQLGGQLPDDASPASTFSRRTSDNAPLASHDTDVDTSPAEPPKSATSASFATLKRLTDLSKKHSRKISSGFKFGTSGSNSSDERSSRRGSRLETVVASPVKSSGDLPSTRAALPQSAANPSGILSRHGEPRYVASPDMDESSPAREPSPSSELDDEDWDRDISLSSPSVGQYERGGSASAPNSILKPPVSPSRQTTWVGSQSSFFEMKARGGGDPDKEAKERRRQSWNDFIIPRGVLEKQRELKKGIEGVKKFAGGIEGQLAPANPANWVHEADPVALKGLLEQRAAFVERYASLNDTSTPEMQLLELDAEFSQWWEMAIVLIEVGSTGQAGSTSPDPESPKRTRRITLASDEARRTADMMRRSQSHASSSSVSRQAPFLPFATLSRSSGSMEQGKDETRKSSLPDPASMALGDTLASPPRASPDIWRASTGRQDLSKRQLEVLRTMLRTPVSDSSVPGRSDLMRGLSTISASSTSSSVDRTSPVPSVTPHSCTHLRHALRPSISRASTVDSSFTPSRGISPSAGLVRGPETFPSPNDSAYIVPSQSFPSPLTASAMAMGRPQSKVPQPREGGMRRTEEGRAEGSKMRRGSKAGLAGLKEFLRGLKGKESRRELNQKRSSVEVGKSRSVEVTTEKITEVGTRLEPALPAAAQGNAVELPISPASPSPGHFRYPSMHRPQSAQRSQADLRRPTHPTPSVSIPNAGQSTIAHPALPHRQSSSSIAASSSTPNTHTLSRQSSQARSARAPGLASTSSGSISAAANIPTLGPPVSGRERKRPGLRGIFRAGSGSWGDLVRGTSGSGDGEARRSSRELHHPPSSIIPPAGLSSSPVRSPTVVQRSLQARPGEVERNQGVSWQSVIASPPLPGEAGPAIPQNQSDTTKHHVREGEVGGASEMTVRPRKSRTLGLGLGWPDEVGRNSQVGSRESSNGSIGATPPKSIPRRTSSRNFSQVSVGFDGSVEPPVSTHGGGDDFGPARDGASGVDPQSLDTLTGGSHGITRGKSTRESISVARANSDGAPRAVVAANEGAAMERQNSDSVHGQEEPISLTPESLPVLLEYLRQCRGKLEEWRVRVEKMEGQTRGVQGAM